MLKRRVPLRTALTATIAALWVIAMPGPASAQHMQTTPVINAYFKMVFSGDTSGAAALFAGAPEDHGSRMLAGKFDARFVERTDGLDLSAIESAEVRAMMELFQSYWRDALMQTAPREALEENLRGRLDQILVARGYASAIDDEAFSADSLVNVFSSGSSSKRRAHSRFVSSALAPSTNTSVARFTKRSG